MSTGKNEKILPSLDFSRCNACQRIQYNYKQQYDILKDSKTKSG